MAVLTQILVVNAGSSSLKLRVLNDADEVTGSADLPPPRDGDDGAAIKAAIEPFGQVHAVGHRIVHGGTEFSGPVLIRAAARLGFLGVHVDNDQNDTAPTDRDIGPPDAPVHVLVISAREDIEIARQVREVIPP